MKLIMLLSIIVAGISLSFGQPQLEFPQNEANDIPINVNLSWFQVAGATTYDVEVDTTGRFHPDTQIFSSYNISNTSITLTDLDYYRGYYWRARSFDGTNLSNWSDPWRFTTENVPIPPKVTLQKPDDGIQNIPTNPLMDWKPILIADHYHLQISDNSFMSMVYDNETISVDSLQLPADALQENTDFQWRVRAVNSTGVGPWSDIWAFETRYMFPPDQVNLNQPGQDAVDIELDVGLTWYSEDRAEKYHLQMIESGGTFATPMINDSLLTMNMYSPNNLRSDTQYFWRVRAINDAGSSAWSVVWGFTTRKAALVKPGLKNPGNNTSDIGLDPVLEWTGVAGAQTYQLELATSFDFTSNLKQYQNLMDTTHQVGPLDAESRYYWRVNAYNADFGTSPWSDIYSFTTQANNNDGLPPPNLANPSNFATNIELRPTLSWSNVTNAQAYQVEVSTDNGFANIVFAEYSVYQEYITVTNDLDGNQVHFWRARTVDTGAGVGNWSPVWEFTTLANVNVATHDDAQPGVVSAYVKGYIEIPAGRNDVFFEYSENGSEFNQWVVSGSPFNNPENRVVDAVLTDLNPGTQYTYRLVVSSDQGRFQGIEYGFRTNDYPQNFNMSYNLSFPKKNRPEDYTPYDFRLVGLPGERDQLLGDVLPGEHRQSWQAYWDNGKESEYLVEYYPDHQGPFVTDLGKGFWLLVSEDVYLDQQTPSAQLQSADMAQIWLHTGWNIITNPFPDRAVGWSDVQQANDFYEQLWAFDGSFSTSNEMQPYQGYYVYNSTGSNGTLNIPYTQMPSAGPKVKETQAEGWECSLNLKTDKNKQTEIRFGIGSGAQENLDALDYRKPHAVGAIADIFFHRPEWDEKYPNFARDMRQEIGDVQRWPFQVTTPDKKQLLLSCDALVNIPQEYRVYLVDLNSASGHDLREEYSYRFTPVYDKTEFELLVGTADEIDKILAEMVPHEFSLGKNFPNPFNPLTTIPFSLPQDSEVALTIYSLLGQKIKVLHQGLLQAGKHFLTWNGLDDSGRQAASGVYFYVLKTGNGTPFSGKMILLK